MGICGTAMGNTAIMLKKLGHTVCGADTDVYPPMSNVLIDAGIAIEDGFNPKKLEKLEPDLVVVGNVISRGNPEIEWLLETKRFKFTSLPALLQDFILSDRYNIVISGTHGKTTTSSIIAYLLDKLGSTPGYLIGGVPQDLPTGACEGIKGGPFVIEGDEYDSAFFDKTFSAFGTYSIDNDPSSDGLDNDDDGIIDGDDSDEFGDSRELAINVAINKIAVDIVNTVLSTW